MFLDLIDQVFLAKDDARLRTTEQFIAREADKIDSSSQRLLHGRFVSKSIFCRVEQCSRTKIIHNNDISFMSNIHNFFQFRFFSEANDLEVTAVGTHDE